MKELFVEHYTTNFVEFTYGRLAGLCGPKWWKKISL